MRGGWRHSRAVRRRAEISVRGGGAGGEGEGARDREAAVDAREGGRVRDGGGAVIYWKSARDA